MERFFNTAGPVKADLHYVVPPLSRLDLPDVLRLIDQQKYFVLHAPRQTGKTSCLLALMERLNREGRYRCLYTNVEAGQAGRENVALAMEAILGRIADNARYYLGDPTLLDRFREVLSTHGPLGALETFLSLWASDSPKPAVLLVDEIDSLVGDTLIAVLRQIRSGYTRRPAAFPQSIVLCGVRDVRDYRLRTDEGKEIITGGSAFNIKATSLRLGSFVRDEVAELYGEHTRETGQVFEPAALDRAWSLTRGQPWLVNALAFEACFEMREARDRVVPVTAELIERAKENLIVRRETHLDQLADKLKEERVRRVIEPLLAGVDLAETVPEDDVQYVIDLGLVTRGPNGLEIANPIYREVIPRQLTAMTQLSLESRIRPAWYVAADGRLDVRKLLAAFQEFFRENAESWLERFQYREAGPQLLMQAFLQRVVNGGGAVAREYGLGTGRTDLLLTWPHPGGTQRVVIELKVLHKSLSRTIADGLKQTAEYLDRTGTSEGHLVIFDRTIDKPWEEKVFVREEREGERNILVWGL